MRKTKYGKIYRKHTNRLVFCDIETANKAMEICKEYAGGDNCCLHHVTNSICYEISIYGTKKTYSDIVNRLSNGPEKIIFIWTYEN